MRGGIWLKSVAPEQRSFIRGILRVLYQTSQRAIDAGSSPRISPSGSAARGSAIGSTVNAVPSGQSTGWVETIRPFFQIAWMVFIVESPNRDRMDLGVAAA
jgi:hypothetical protein